MEEKQEKLPLISIIVPVYNGERYLRECIESILNQDYKNIELILINDGSKDNSKEIIDEYAMKDKRIIAIHQNNAGVCVSRNNGLNVSNGEYICLIDQDDYISTDYISYLYNLITKNNVEISLTPTARKFTVHSKNNNLIDKNDYDEIWTGEKAVQEMLCYNLIIAPWNKMISKKLIKENDIKFDVNFYGGEGFLFSIDCYLKANKIAVGHRKIYNYRCDNPNSGMTKFRMKVVDSSIESQKVIKEHVLYKYPNLDNACGYSNWHTYCDCLNFFVGCKVVNQYREKYNEVKKVCKKEAKYALKVNVSAKEKIKGILYMFSPFFASKIINYFRVREFTIEQEEK